MKFSVCIPTYNRAHTIERAINSVLSQDYFDFEIIIIDDGSKDDTSKIISKYNDNRIVYKYKENGGKHSALNEGINISNGDYFIILDSDDYLNKECLSVFNKVLENQINNDLIVGAIAKSKSIDGVRIDNPFEKKTKYISYIDLHYKTKKKYGDCIEAIKMKMIKRYSFPLGDFHFVPERYIFDKIGLLGKMICLNDVLKIVEYQTDGITKNARTHLKNNAEGFLIDCCDKIINIFPHQRIRLFIRFKMWFKYWVLYRCVGKKEYKIKKTSILKIISRILSKFYKL